jgi:hypothetical protein
MIKTYPYDKPIPHFFALRLVVCSPVFLVYHIFNFIATKLERVCIKLDNIIPDAYEKKFVEWDQLPKHQQEAIERLAKARDTTKERILFQTVNHN